MNTKLKPCPFCGHEPEVYQDVRRNTYWVFCDYCGGKGPEIDDKERAINRWNTRTPSQEEQAT
jgi:Lar family restriction alleviation protein